jgi:hypothetical protein
MNIEILAYLKKGESSEAININFDDATIEYFILQYLRENYNTYELEDWSTLNICID